MLPTLTNHPHIEMLSPSALSPSPTHAHKRATKQIEQIAASIDRFGFLVPIICDDAGVIAAGVGRWEAARLRKWPEVPVIRARFLTEADRRAFALADNRIAEFAEWDEAKLAAELEYLFEQDYQIDITGFDIADLDVGLDGPAREEPVELPDADAIAVSRPGDLWHIGLHRLLCGNARDAASYEALLGNELAAMIFADPPYNVPIDGHVSGLGKVRHREFAEASGEMTPAAFTAFLRSVFRNCARFSSNGSIHYHCMDWRHFGEMQDAADGVYSEFKQLIVWAKTNAGMGAFYRSQHELVFVFKASKGSHVNNFGLGEKGRHRSNVWSYAGANTFRKGRNGDLANHPTVKPTAMVADAILDCSNRGDLILDPFCGSGTTLLAAHSTRRRGAAIEIDPLYVDVALRRLSKASGLTPMLDGRSFDQVAAVRAGAMDHG